MTKVFITLTFFFIIGYMAGKARALALPENDWAIEARVTAKQFKDIDFSQERLHNIITNGITTSTDMQDIIKFFVSGRMLQKALNNFEPPSWDKWKW